jgi:AcrR family transcriptional regulator
MQQLHISIKVPEQIYVKDPVSSELGRQILAEGLVMISDLGLEAFTFKKLALKLGTAESAIYRYFENKHKLLLYYANWYWAWLEYHLVFKTVNVSNPSEKLEKAIRTLVNIPIHESHELLDLKILQEVILAEAGKAYHTKGVDQENKAGVFLSYKRLSKRLADIVLEVNPKYPFANSLSSLVLEGVHHHDFIAQHLPSLTNFKVGSEEKFKFFYQLIVKTTAP